MILNIAHPPNRWIIGAESVTYVRSFKVNTGFFFANPLILHIIVVAQDPQAAQATLREIHHISQWVAHWDDFSIYWTIWPKLCYLTSNPMSGAQQISLAVLNKIWDIPVGSKLIAANVASLYTNIPNKECLAAMFRRNWTEESLIWTVRIWKQFPWHHFPHGWDHWCTFDWPVL